MYVELSAESSPDVPYTMKNQVVLTVWTSNSALARLGGSWDTLQAVPLA